MINMWYVLLSLIVGIDTTKMATEFFSLKTHLKKFYLTKAD